MGAGNLFVLFCLFLIVSPYGRVRIGGAEARPLRTRAIAATRRKKARRGRGKR